MAPVEVDHIPASIESPVKFFKVVDKAMSLPLVSSAYTGVSKITYPYVESTMNKMSPMVENTWGKVTPVMETVKSKMEESVLPRIPTKVSETVQNVHNVTVDKVIAAVDKVDTFACGGIDQLTDKIPQLKESPPKLIEDTKTSVSSYLAAITDYAASFQVSQLTLKVIDSSLDVVDGALNKIGSDEKGTVRSGVRKVHSTANTIRISAVKKQKVGTEKAKKIEEASVFEAFIDVSGLSDVLEFMGLRLRKTDSSTGTAVYEDEHARVEMRKYESEETEPVVVDTE